MKRIILFLMNLIGKVKARAYGILESRVESLGGYKLEVYFVKRDIFRVYGDRVAIVGPSFAGYWTSKLKPAAFAEACFHRHASLLKMFSSEAKRSVIKKISNMYHADTRPPFVDGAWVGICKNEIRNV